MAPTPRPEGWQGGSEDFGFIRTLDGHLAEDHFATGAEAEDNVRSGRNARKSFEDADLSGEGYGVA